MVIRVETEDEVGHASAVLLDTKPGCFQGLGTWVVGLQSRVTALQSRGFGPLSLPYPGVRICPVGLNQVGEFKLLFGKLSRGLTSFCLLMNSQVRDAHRSL